MSCAFDHKKWDALGLQDFEDFSEKITFCNQTDLGDCTKGEWYYIPDEPINGMMVIYSGSFGNENAPGASSYTYADTYDSQDEYDIEMYVKNKKEWEESPEYAED